VTSVPLALGDLVEADLLQATLANHGLDVDSARPTYIRYKPGVGAVVAVELSVGSEVHLGYLRYGTDPGRVAQIVAKAMTMTPTPTPLGEGIRALDANTALFLFPNDYRVRRLRWVSSGRKIRHIVAAAFPEDGPYAGRRSTVEILRYKPERRVVGRANLEQWTVGEPTRAVFFRLLADPEASTVARTNTAARAAGLPVAEPLGVFEDGRLHIEEAIVGEPLVDCVDRLPETEEVALMLHDITKVDAPFLPQLTAAADLSHTAQVLDSLLVFHPDLEVDLSTLLRKLSESAPETNTATVIHGDLHLNQFMLGVDKLWLVDWERASYGHPYSDIGRLLAHPLALQVRRPELRTAELQSFVSGVVEQYRCLSPALSGDLDFYVAVGLLDQALLVSRHLEPQWQARSRQILTLASATLAKGADRVVSNNQSLKVEEGP